MSEGKGDVVTCRHLLPGPEILAIGMATLHGAANPYLVLATRSTVEVITISSMTVMGSWGLEDLGLGSRLVSAIGGFLDTLVVVSDFNKISIHRLLDNGFWEQIIDFSVDLRARKESEPILLCGTGEDSAVPRIAFLYRRGHSIYVWDASDLSVLSRNEPVEIKTSFPIADAIVVKNEIWALLEDHVTGNYAIDIYSAVDGIRSRTIVVGGGDGPVGLCKSGDWVCVVSHTGLEAVGLLPVEDNSPLLRQKIQLPSQEAREDSYVAKSISFESPQVTRLDDIPHPVRTALLNLSLRPADNSGSGKTSPKETTQLGRLQSVPIAWCSLEDGLILILNSAGCACVVDVETASLLSRQWEKIEGGIFPSPPKRVLSIGNDGLAVSLGSSCPSQLIQCTRSNTSCSLTARTFPIRQPPLPIRSVVISEGQSLHERDILLSLDGEYPTSCITAHFFDSVGATVSPFEIVIDTPVCGIWAGPTPGSLVVSHTHETRIIQVVAQEGSNAMDVSSDGSRIVTDSPTIGFFESLQVCPTLVGIHGRTAWTPSVATIACCCRSGDGVVVGLSSGSVSWLVHSVGTGGEGTLVETKTISNHGIITTAICSIDQNRVCVAFANQTLTLFSATHDRTVSQPPCIDLTTAAESVNSIGIIASIAVVGDSRIIAGTRDGYVFICDLLGENKGVMQTIGVGIKSVHLCPLGNDQVFVVSDFAHLITSSKATENRKDGKLLHCNAVPLGITAHVATCFGFNGRFNIAVVAGESHKILFCSLPENVAVEKAMSIATVVHPLPFVAKAMTSDSFNNLYILAWLGKVSTWALCVCAFDRRNCGPYSPQDAFSVSVTLPFSGREEPTCLCIWPQSSFPDGGLVVVGTRGAAGGRLILFDTTTMQPVARTSVPSAEVSTLAVVSRDVLAFASDSLVILAGMQLGPKGSALLVTLVTFSMPATVMCISPVGLLNKTESIIVSTVAGDVTLLSSTNNGLVLKSEADSEFCRSVNSPVIILPNDKGPPVFVFSTTDGLLVAGKCSCTGNEDTDDGLMPELGTIAINDTITAGVFRTRTNSLICATRGGGLLEIITQQNHIVTSTRRKSGRLFFQSA